MNEQAINDAYQHFVSTGYNGTIQNFYDLINSDKNALKDSYKNFAKTGYNGSIDDFSNLMGLGKVQGSTVDPTMSQDDMGSELDDGLSESVSWFDQTWFGRGIAAASTTGEATDLMSEDFSNVSVEAIQEFMKAKEQEAKTHVPSERMEKFQKKYKEEGSTWSAFFRGVKDQPGLLPELFVQSLGTQIGTLIDSPGASLAAVGAGAAAGAAATAYTGYGAIAGGLTGAMGGLATSMEAALTFGELIEAELKKEGKEFSDVNIKELLEGPKGRSIRNKALGRGLAIGAIEGFTGGLAGKATLATKAAVQTARSGKVGKRGIAAASGVGVGVEAIGGGTGEVAGRLAAGQEMDAAEIGFEAITGTVTAPINVGGALLSAKKAKYYLNDMKNPVTYAEFKDFVDTADDVDIASAKLKVEGNDFTGIGKKAEKKISDAHRKSQIDDKITDEKDIKDLLNYSYLRDNAKADLKKEGVNKVPDAEKNLKDIDAKIDAIISKYEGAIDIADTQEAAGVRKARRDASVAETIAFAETKGKLIRKDVKVVENDQAAQEAADKLGYKGNVQGSDGFIFGDSIIINKDVAGRQGAINVGAHELLHGVMAKHLKSLVKKIKDKNGKVISEDKTELKKFVSDFKNFLSDKQRKWVENELITNYQDQIKEAEARGENFLDTTDEWFNKFIDGIATEQITYDESSFSKLKSFFERIFRKFGYNKEFGSGRQTYDFLKDYQQSAAKGELSFRAQAVAGKGTAVTEGKFSISKDQTNSVNELASMGWTNETWKEQGADFAIKEMQSNKMLDGLIRSKYKADVVPGNFVDLVYSELVSHVKNFKPEQNDNLFGWVNSQIANKAGNVYNREFKVADEMKGAKDIGKTTKEGEVKVQVAAETDTAMEALETEDLSPAAQAKKKADKAKGKQKVESEFRRKIGIETNSDLYNKVLDSAKKALLRAYEAGTSVRNIQRKLRDEANVYLFKSVKNFLGTKDYVKNLKKFREPIIKAIFTADLVQLERNVPDSDRVLTTFVEKLTSKQDVENAVNQKLLPPSALNIIDKGTAVSVYKKKTPTEKQFLDFFYTPLINPVTGSRSGLRGTRKDGLAKAMAGALSYDATMEVAQDPEVAQTRADLAELKGESLAQDNLETLAAAIGRDPNVKFSYSQADVNLGINILEGKNKNDGFGGVNWNNWFNDPNIDNRVKKEVTDNYLKRNTEQNDAISNKELAKLDFFKNGKPRKTKIRTYKKYEIIAKQRAEKLIKDLGLSKEGYVVENLSEKDNNPDIRITRNGKTVLAIEIKGNTARGVSISFNYKKDGKGLTKSKRAAQKQETENYNKKEKSLINDSNKVFEEMIDFVGKDQTQYSLQGNLQITVEGVKKIKEKGIHLKIYDKKYFIETADVANSYTQKKGKDGASRTSHVIDLGNAGMFIMDNTSDLKIKGLKNFSDQKAPIPFTARINFGSINKAGTHRTASIRMEPQLNSLFFDKQDVSLINKSKNKNIKLSFSKSQQTSMSQDIMNVANKARTTAHFSKSRGASIFDFDETVGISENFVVATKGDVTRKIASDEWPIYGETLKEQGYEFDFTDFNKVTKGKPGPLLQKMKNQIEKYGSKNVFILTARAPESQTAIHEWLESEGVNIPAENITGLGNSTGEAKAAWILDKYSNKNYNDIYFVDDAMQNVKAVQNLFDQLDIKGKSVQAKINFSNSMNDQFNDILENVTGIESKKRFSIIKGRKRGESKGKFRYFVPPSHEDFVGLLYNFMGKGKEGNKHRDFLEQALVRPLNRANRELDTARQSVANDYKELNKQFKDVKSKLTKKTPDGDFTFQDAIRVYLWNKHGHKIPGLSETDQAKLSELVMSDTQLQAYAENLNVISKQENYVAPTEGWNSGDIRMDLDDATGRIGREQHFSEFIENTDIIFSEENLNKIEAGYGQDVRESLEDMLYRIKTGRNRPTGQNAQVNKLMNYLNGSVGTVMFFNMRSALLQQMSIVNYINFADNNIFAAAKAFANQKQYWADWSFIFNSDMLKQRRGGIQTDVNGAELAASLRNSKDISRKLVSKLLQLGFLPTQIGDNIAIATGGATYYRNRINKYVKQGMSQKEAEAAAFTDFQDITQSTQQSARPDMVSKQQASVIGKVILNFQNVTSQFNRLGKKAFQDIYNRRITKPNTTQIQSDISNAARITYYFAVQNAIFYTLQTALFAMMFDDDEEDVNNLFIKKRERLINGSIDSVLRGTGLIGSVVATLKNVAIAFARQRDVKYNPDESAVMLEALNLSPVLGIKGRKIVNAEKTLNYNKKVIDEMETLDIDNPQWSAVTNYTEAFTNVPLNRLYNKTQNVRQALNNDHSAWERTLMFLGWSQYNLNLENKKMDEIKEKTKNKKKTNTRSRTRTRTRSRTRTR